MAEADADLSGVADSIEQQANSRIPDVKAVRDIGVIFFMEVLWGFLVLQIDRNWRAKVTAKSNAEFRPRSAGFPACGFR
jgi:hypothetical protein